MKMKILEVTIIKAISGKVLARADVHFEGFWLKGFKVIQDETTKKEFVTPPSYQAGNFWRPLFKTDSLEDWQEIQRTILNEFTQQQIKESLEENYEK